MTRRKKAGIILFILLGLFFLLNTTLVWKWMYPIKYENEIQTYAKQYNVSPYLVLAIIRTESAFDAERTSKKGALGLMQVMPETAHWAVEQVGMSKIKRDDLKNPFINIEIGTWYLAYLLKTFNGDEIQAIAAYNAGQGKVNTWIMQKRWNGTRDSIQDIPYGETRHYVQRVLYYKERYEKIYGSTFQ